jgi:hypothetical protein
LNEYYENGNQLLRNGDKTAVDTQNKDELHHLLAEESNCTQETECRPTLAENTTFMFLRRVNTGTVREQVPQGHHLYISSTILGQERNLDEVGFLTPYAGLYDIILQETVVCKASCY